MLNNTTVLFECSARSTHLCVHLCQRSLSPLKVKVREEEEEEVEKEAEEEKDAEGVV